jgi:hypothetical protein
MRMHLTLPLPYTSLKNSSDQHSSLFYLNFSDEEKSFIHFIPGEPSIEKQTDIFILFLKTLIGILSKQGKTFSQC